MITNVNPENNAGQQAEDKEGYPVISSFGAPNIIGNASEHGDEQRKEGHQFQSIDEEDNQDALSLPEGLSNFKDITSMLTRSKRKK